MVVFEQTIMIEIKQLIKSRIESILQLQQIISSKNVDQAEKYTRLSTHKQQEKIRAIKENDILATLTNISLKSLESLQEFYTISVDICAAYNLHYRQYSKRPFLFLKDSIRKLYTEFFLNHGFEDKAKAIDRMMETDLKMISPAMYLGWLSEWSKQIYCKMLQVQLKEEMKNKISARRKISQASRLQTQLTIQHTISPKSFQNTQNYANTAKFYQTNADGKLIQQNISTTVVSLNSKMVSLSCKTIAEKPSRSPSVFIHNKENVYSYFLQDFYTYYKSLSKIEDLDINYPHLIKKLGRKQDLLHPQNLNKAVQVLIASTSNSVIKDLINTYELQCRNRSPKKKGYKTRPHINSQISKRCTQIRKIQDSTQLPSQNMTWNIRMSALSQNPQSSQLLQYRRNNLEFLTSQQISKSIQRLKVLEKDKCGKKRNLEFPKIRKGKICNYSNSALVEAMTSSDNKIGKKKNKIQRWKQYSNEIAKAVNEKGLVKCSSISSKLKARKKLSYSRSWKDRPEMKELRFEMKHALTCKVSHGAELFHSKNFNPEQLREVGRERQKVNFVKQG